MPQITAIRRAAYAGLALTALVLLLSGCQAPAKPADQERPKAQRTSFGRWPGVEITVAAASDLKAALPEVAKAFKKKTGAGITLTFGSSGLLAAQMENGAPFDIFLSADKDFIDGLVAKKIITDSKPYAGGLVVLIGKARSLDDLRAPEIDKIAVANPDHAPYGKAAKEALEKQGLWADVQPKIVYAENVAQALEFVGTGNADAGFAALSLAKPNKIEYRIVEKKLYTSIEQWAGLSSRSANQSAGEAFIGFLRSQTAQKILESYGYQRIDRGNL